jgi:hypothetical protein
MKRFVAFRLDRGGGSVLVRRSQSPCRKGICLVLESKVPVIARLVDSHVSS